MVGIDGVYEADFRWWQRCRDRTNLGVGRWALDVEVIPSIIRGKPRGRLAYFANFAVNSIETNSIVNFAENCFDIR